MVNTKLFLDDEFSISGNNMSDLTEKAKALTDITKTNTFPIKKVNFLKFKEEKENSYIFYEINDFVEMEDIAIRNCVLDEHIFSKNEFSEDFFKAAKKTAVLNVGHEYYVLSQKAMFSIKDKFKADANYMTSFSLPTLLTLREAANSSNESIKIIYREVGNIKKIFYVGCENFCEQLNDMFMIELLDKLPLEMARELELVKFTISQENTIIYNNFPEIEEEISKKYKNFNLKPILIAKNSMIGDSSMIFQEGWQTASGLTLRGNGVAAKHLFKEREKNLFENKEKEIIEKIKEKIFVDYFELPKRFEELSNVEITSEEMTLEEMKFTYESIIEEVIKKCFKTELSRKKKALIKERLRNRFTSSEPITALMIVNEFLEIISELTKKDCSKDIIDKIEKSVSLIPFFDFEKELKTINVLSY